MRRSTLVRWAALGVGLLLCPLLSGCFVPLGAAWPSVAVTPALQVNAASDQVHAFRVEVVDAHAVVDFQEPSVYTLREVTVATGGWLVPQGEVACDYAWCWNFGVVNYWKMKHHSVMVRLYRPGCETVEVSAWAMPKEVQWRGVADLAGQEKAVDDLVSIGDTESIGHLTDAKPDGWWVARCLAAGSASPEHRKALLFAASEYERLAKEAPADAASRALRDRMEKKAAWLRALAARSSLPLDG